MNRLYSSVVALVFLGMSGVASAACNVSGYVIHTYSVHTGGNDYQYVYVNPFSTWTPLNYSYYFRLNNGDDAGDSAIASAFAGNHSVSVYGDASSCGTGATRWGGNVNYVHVWRNY
jgi:hypothetical protein